MIEIVIQGAIPKPVTEARIRRSLESAFSAVGKKPHGSVSVSFVLQPRMRELNKKWRKIDRPTDVLSFSPSDILPKELVKDKDWGDLFISPAYVRHEAEMRHIDFQEELLRVTIHGMLHLFGYDHATKDEEKIMFGIQEKVLMKLLSTV